VPGTLSLVSTPIGNLEDVTARAARVLREADAVLCEDTRHSRRLLDHVGSTAPTLALHEHNEARATDGLVRRLLDGAHLALVSDAGTPLLSDPGARLVRAALDAGVTVTPIPGPSALLAALVAAGLDATRFTFYGFLARKGRERRDALAELATLRHTAVLYEALTKQFEEVRRGTLTELAAYYAERPPRGEVVLVLGGASSAALAVDPETLRDRARALYGEGRTARDVARALEGEFGVGRNEAYRVAQESAGPAEG
jgi:16S rRNA (cytidine1402-2'-O)-methyltransferase